MPTPLTDADKVLRNDTGKDIVEKLDDIAQALGVGVNANQINYDNTESGLTADDVQEAIDELHNNTIYKKTATPGPIVSFSDGGDNIPIKSLITEIEVIQEGTGTPSPTNVRTISGRQNINVVRCGFNIWDEEWVRGYYSATTGALVETSTTALASSKHLKVYPDLKIKCICPSTLSFVIFRYDKNGNYINRITGIATGSVITIPSDVYEIAFHVANYGSDTSYTYQNNVSLNIPDSDSQYRSYNGEKVIIALDQTVYGGFLECVEGKGQSNLGIIDLGDLTWSGPDETYHRFTTTVSGLISSGTRLTKLYCSCYQTIDDGRPIGEVPNNSIYTAAVAPSDRIYIHDTQYSSASDFTTAVTGQKLVFTITPISLSVTGENIPTLSGVNNIYTDCGDIQSLEYYNDKTDELANLIRLMTRT